MSEEEKIPIENITLNTLKTLMSRKLKSTFFELNQEDDNLILEFGGRKVKTEFNREKKFRQMIDELIEKINSDEPKPKKTKKKVEPEKPDSTT